jgi:DNA polymerase-3 subunit delta'
LTWRWRWRGLGCATLSLSLGWPLDQKTQEELDNKKRKPSKEIKVDAARQVVTFSQLTRSRGPSKVVLVFPAERMNGITANTLLKTLEEPPGEVKFILATEAAQQLLPTIRSRCQSHTMRWPAFEESLAWLQSQSAMDESAKTGRAKPPPPKLEDLRVLLAAAGGRPADALTWVQGGAPDEAARDWQALPKAMARGDVGALTGWAPALVVDALQKICHDVWAVKVGAQPRFFTLSDLPLPARQPASVETQNLGSPASIFALSAWSKELATSARTVEHPYNPGLMLEALVSRAKQALTTR